MADMDVRATLGEAARALPVVPKAGSKAGALQQAAQDFEAYFIGLLSREMNKTLESGGLFGGPSLGGYRALLDDALAKRAAQAGSFGLARQLLAQWEANGMSEPDPELQGLGEAR